MSHIQRVLKAIQHQPAARIPTGELLLERSFMEAFLAWKGGRVSLEKMDTTQLRIECCRLLGHDLVCLQSQLYATHDCDPSLPLKDIARIVGEGLFVFWIVDGVFQQTLHRQGFMPFMKAIAESPDGVGADMAQASQAVATLIEQGVSHGAHGIIIADDIAYQNSTYVSPAFGERYLLPLWRRQVMVAKALGVPVFFHSDGDIKSFLPLIVAAGFDGLQCIEPAAGMDLPAIKRKYGNDLCLMGNVDPVLLSQQDNQRGADMQHDRLMHVVSDLMASAADADGGFIFGTCSGLYAGLSPELVQFMYDVVSGVNANS